MPKFTDRLLRCAYALCANDPNLTRLLDVYGPSLVEVDATTHEVDLSCYPNPPPRRWDADRITILGLLYAECGADLSEALSFEAYAAARARGRLLVTSVHALMAGRMNVVIVPLEEIETRGDWALTVSVVEDGEPRPLRKSAWVLQMVREKMTDAWTGFALAELFTFVHALLASETLRSPPGYHTLADAFRSPDLPHHAVALKVAMSEMRRQMLGKLLPNRAFRSIPYGLVYHPDAIAAYQELVLEDVGTMTGPPLHAAEARLRESIIAEAVLAQCVGSSVLPNVLEGLLNSQ